MDRVKTQLLRVVQILPTRTQRKYALAQKRGRNVGDLARLAFIGERLRSDRGTCGPCLRRLVRHRRPLV